MEKPPRTKPDWSNLQDDVLITVLAKLEFPDLFRSAIVCTTWRAAAHDLRRLGLYNRPQTPCLFYTTAAAGPRAAELFSLGDKSIYKVRLPDPPIAERRIFGSSHGWLVTADARSELHLLNPVTGKQLALPPVATIEHVNPVLDHAGGLQGYDLSFYDATLPRDYYEDTQRHLVDNLRDSLYYKVVLSCHPSRGDCVAMMIHNPDWQLSFARVGDDKWHWVTPSFYASKYSDCIFHDGVFYAMNFMGCIHRYMIGDSCATGSKISRDPGIYLAENIYISRTSSGDVLQIIRWSSYTHSEPVQLHTTSIDLCKVNFDKQNTVDIIDTLGDGALFIGHNYTCCVSTKDYPELLPNHVYFTDDTEDWLIRGTLSRRDAKIYSLKDKNVSDVVSPQHWLKSPIPVWITPSFTKIHK